MFPTNFDEETRVQANLMLDWSTTSEAAKAGRIDECLQYIRRIVEKRHLVILARPHPNQSSSVSVSVAKDGFLLWSLNKQETVITFKFK